MANDFWLFLTLKIYFFSILFSIHCEMLTAMFFYLDFFFLFAKEMFLKKKVTITTTKKELTNGL